MLVPISPIFHVLLGFTLIITTSSIALPQVPGVPSVAAAKEAEKLRVAYAVLLQSVNSIDTKAKADEASGKDSTPAKELFKRRLALTASEDLTLKSVAMVFTAEVAKTDGMAKDVIDKFRKANAGKNAAFLPPPPLELTSLQQAKNVTIDSFVQRLSRELGPAGFGKIDAFVKSSIRVDQIDAPPPTQARAEERQRRRAEITLRKQ